MRTCESASVSRADVAGICHYTQMEPLMETFKQTHHRPRSGVQRPRCAGTFFMTLRTAGDGRVCHRSPLSRGDGKPATLRVTTTKLRPEAEEEKRPERRRLSAEICTSRGVRGGACSAEMFPLVDCISFGPDCDTFAATSQFVFGSNHHRGTE